MHMSEQRISESSSESLTVRRTRRVRLIEQSGRVIAYPEPHRTPVLPGGWAPLNREQQQAVLSACDAAAECLFFRLGSLWDTGTEYRVYRLANELWGGLSVVTKSADGAETAGRGLRNRHLIGLAWDTLKAVRIAVDFFNWDLETHGQPWRLDVTTGVEQT
jgi:hypothetical protein